MTVKALIKPISGGAEVAPPFQMTAPGALYAVDFLRPRQRSASPAPSGRETALRGRPLTKAEEEESIIINRPGRSTYPEEKSVSRSGATPQQQAMMVGGVALNLGSSVRLLLSEFHLFIGS